METNLREARESMSYVVLDMRHAFRKANAVESIVLIQLLERASRLEKELADLLNAIDGGKQWQRI